MLLLAFNNMLQLWDIHVGSYSDYLAQKDGLKRALSKARKQTRKAKQENRLLRDILRGLKRNELYVLHNNVERIEELVDKFGILRNIFVSP